MLDLVVSPYVIIGALAVGVGGIVVTGAIDPRSWVALLAVAAGWSSAWSP